MSDYEFSTEPRVFTWIYLNYSWIKWCWKALGWSIVVIFLISVYPDSKFGKSNKLKAEISGTQNLFVNEYSNYTALLNSNLPIASAPFRSGKVYIARANSTPDFDDLEMALPESMRPKSPQDVDYLARIVTEEKVVGRYSSGGSAYQWVWRLKVVDVHSKQIVINTDISGSAPPSSIRVKRGSSGSGHGSEPRSETINFLIQSFG
jgi:hypothetical protein